MDNLLYMFENLNRSKLDNKFLSPLNSGEKQSCNLQLLLIPIIFGEKKQLQDKALLILLSSWIAFPAKTVDVNPAATLYTTLFTITWIFLRVEQNDISDQSVLFLNQFPTTMAKFEQFLLMYFPSDMEDLRRGLNRLQEIMDSNSSIPTDAQSILFKQCAQSALSYFLNEFGNNIAHYLGQIMSISRPYQSIGLRMTQLLWEVVHSKSHDINSFTYLRSLIRSIPFLKDNNPEVARLVISVFDEAQNASFFKDVDVTSQGRTENMPELELANGSVRYFELIRAASKWLSVDLGITPSNKLYELM